MLLRRTMKTDDLRPYLQVQIFNSDGSPRDLTGDIVTFIMKKDDTIKVNAPATLILATQGIVEYRWQAGDTDEEGSFRGEFEINGIDTYPKEGFIVIEFGEDLN